MTSYWLLVLLFQWLPSWNLYSRLVALYYIWKARNCLRLHNHPLSFIHAKNLISSHLSFFRVASPQTGNKSRPIYSALHLSCASRPYSSIIIWHSPRAPWIKIDTNGLGKGNPAVAACGAVFRGLVLSMVVLHSPLPIKRLSMQTYMLF